jgi:Asp/Glu/hydantoin racemase
MRIWHQSYVDYENGATYWDALRPHLAASASQGVSVEVHGVTPHDNYAHPIVEFRCARQVVKNAVRAEREGWDAFVFGHFQDAGLLEARSVVDIPVIGLGEASMLAACQLGRRIGVVTINPRYTPWIERQIAAYGLERRVTDVHAMTFQPGEILAAFHDETRFEEVVASFRRQAEPLVDSGVEVIIPGGGIPMLLFSRLHDFRVADAPVMNGLPVALRQAEMMVALKRLSGLGVSRSAEFARPPAEVLQQFLDD